MSMPEAKKTVRIGRLFFGAGLPAVRAPAGKTGLFCMNPRLFCGKKGPGVV